MILWHAVKKAAIRPAVLYSVDLANLVNWLACMPRQPSRDDFSANNGDLFARVLGKVLGQVAK